MDTLYKNIVSNFLMFPVLSDKDKTQFITDIKEFVEKQKILFFRMNLSDDPEAKETREMILNNAHMIGLAPNCSMDEYFEMLEDILKKLEKSMIS